MASINKVRVNGTDYDILKDELALKADQTEVDALKADLTTEQTARENADTALQTAINTKADSTALTAEQTARQNADNALGEDITALSEDVETNYAKIDGYYDSLGVGMADQLASNKYTEDNEPYVYRTSGGTADIGDREYDEIVGGTVVWNQLVPQTGGGNTVEGITFTNNNDGTWTANGTATGKAIISVVLAPKTINDHVIYFCGCPNGGSDNVYRLYINGLSNKIDYGNGVVAKPTGLEYPYLNMQIYSGVTVNNQVWKPQIFDLTQMFGTAVADAIYALEQAEAGAGVAWFKKLFPKDYYPYNAGELISVSALQSHDMVGFNQWDEEWENGTFNTTTGESVSVSSQIRSKNLIPVVGGMQYFYKSTQSCWVIFYDADENVLSNPIVPEAVGTSGNSKSLYPNRVFTMPSNARYMKFYLVVRYGNTYNHDICINLSWSGWRNGEYEAYDKHSYPLDSSLTLRGIPKVDSAGNLYYDGDIYSHDGTVTRKYGVVDLGTLTWNYNSTDSYSYFIAFIADMAKNTYASTNLVCSKYPTMPLQLSSLVYGIRYAGGVSSVMVKDSAYTDAATFKTAMSGVMLVYELATPTTETAQPYASPQIVDDFGIEEYVSTADVRIPVGHNTKYMANLRDKLVHLPNFADSDGAYLIQQTGHTMELVKFRIPKAPTTDGTYTLKATVSGGTPTYTWEVVE